MDARYLSKVKRNDRVARWLIRFGGVSIIGSMLVMILFMIKVTLPLFSEPEKRIMSTFKLPVETENLITFNAGPYLERGFALSNDGVLLVFDMLDGSVLAETRIQPPTEESGQILFSERFGKEDYHLYWSDGSVSQVRVVFYPRFDENGVRTIHHRLERIAEIPPRDGIAADSLALLRDNGDGKHCLVRLVDGKNIDVWTRIRTEDFMGDETLEIFDQLLTPSIDGMMTSLAINEAGTRLYAGTDQGEILVWDLAEPGNGRELDRTVVSESGAVTAMSFLFGDASLVVGDNDGNLSVWMLVAGETARLQRIHTFAAHEASVKSIQPSTKDKSFISLDVEGRIHFNHMTSERFLLDISSQYRLVDFGFPERSDGLLALDTNGTFWFWHFHVPHPDISWSTLWGNIWYEGYKEPSYTWQSSSASDDFEPKLSLVPLLYGSLKGTFYGMLFSFPLALFAAMYVSHLMDPKWRSVIKPVIELMGAIPTVVIGFLGALWLAPKLEHNLLAILMAFLTVPLIVGSGLYWLNNRKKDITGMEFLWGIPFILVAVVLAYYAGLLLQNTVFGGNLNLWLFQELGFSVDQRNCVVISFALGFAVIPIIFTISEDALYNVPKNLSAAALALGSSRWQTLRRVVLPMASPGIFAATMIGFGRAVGETMIVLMATGNTPIMSPSILNGMRTLSANIAVEVPEAPVGSTLYRVLFLSAVLLFSITFVVNTLAEIVRVRLKRKYKNL